MYFCQDLFGVTDATIYGITATYVIVYEDMSFLWAKMCLLLDQSSDKCVAMQHQGGVSRELHDRLSLIQQLSFSLCRSFSPRSFTPVSVNVSPSVIAAWQALDRHSKSHHSSALSLLSGAIIISVIILITVNFITWSRHTVCYFIEQCR